MRTEHLLDVDEGLEYDEDIADWRVLSHTAHGSPAYNPNDEIRIGCWQQNAITLPHQSHLLIEGYLKADGATPTGDNVKFVNNPAAFLFEEVKYFIGGVQVDSTRNVGITSTLKNHCSLDYMTARSLSHTGWDPHYQEGVPFGVNGAWKLYLPLSMLLGFCEDYQKVVTGASQELVLQITSDIKNMVICKKKDAAGALPGIQLKVSKITWRIPYIDLSDVKKLEMLKFIEQDRAISIPFRSWEMYEYPTLPLSDKHVWTVRSSSVVERPRYVILAFQKARKNNFEADNSRFDHCGVENVRLFLNSKHYPYESTYTDFDNNSFPLLYDMYRSFRGSYYQGEPGSDSPPHLTANQFASLTPVHVIDCSNQPEPIKAGAVDIRVEITMRKAITGNDVTAYCLIIHDNILQYTPLTGLIKRVN